MKKLRLKSMGTGLLFATGALFVTLMTAPAAAGFSSQNQDNAALANRLNELENQVQTLSRSVYRGENPPSQQIIYSDGSSSGGGDAGSAAAVYEERISQIEQRQRELNGKIEQMSYDIQQLRARIGGGNYGDTSSAPPPAAGNDTPRSDNGGQQTAYSSTSDYIYGKRDTGGHDNPTVKPLGSYGVPSGSAEGLYEDAFGDIREAHYDTAAAKFQQFMTKYPQHPLASNAQYWLAETYYVKGDYRQSAKLFAQDYQDYPKGSKASASLLKLGLSLSRLGKKDDACLSFQQLKKEFPGGQTPEIRAANDEMKNLGCAG